MNSHSGGTSGQLYPGGELRLVTVKIQQSYAAIRLIVPGVNRPLRHQPGSFRVLTLANITQNPQEPESSPRPFQPGLALILWQPDR